MALTPEERDSKMQEICNLRQDLTSPVSEIGDWKIAKIQECALVGEAAPYDVKELHAKRQAVREKINALQAELDADAEAAKESEAE